MGFCGIVKKVFCAYKQTKKYTTLFVNVLAISSAQLGEELCPGRVMLPLVIGAESCVTYYFLTAHTSVHHQAAQKLSIGEKVTRPGGRSPFGPKPHTRSNSTFYFELNVILNWIPEAVKI